MRGLGVGLAAVLPIVLGCATTSALAPGTPAPPPLAASTGRTTGDGVFTSAQAGDGDRLFRGSCQGCHEPREFSGIRFTIRWSGQSLGELFDVVSTTMPQGSPGSLEAGEYAALAAYLLELNGYPAGETPLPGEAARLRGITIVDPE